MNPSSEWWIRVGRFALLREQTFSAAMDAGKALNCPEAARELVMLSERFKRLENMAREEAMRAMGEARR